MNQQKNTTKKLNRMKKFQKCICKIKIFKMHLDLQKINFSNKNIII